MMKNGDSSFSPTNKIEYKLSNEEYIHLGWTKKPKTKLTRRIILYETEISKPHLKWHKGFSEKFYRDGRVFFMADGDGGRVYYPDGEIAIKIERVGSKNYDLYTIFSPGGKDNFGRDRNQQMIANFDSLGNGLVLDEYGEIRLSYNQIGGVYVDNPGALLPLIWMWNRRITCPIMESTYTETAAVRLLRILEESEQAPKNFAVEMVTETMGPDKKCFSEDDGAIIDGTIDSLTAVKTICFRLNEFMSLRILDRKNINLRFLSGYETVRFQMGFNVNYTKPISSLIKDTSEDCHSFLKSRVQDALNSLQASSSLVKILQEYRTIRQLAKHHQLIENQKKKRDKSKHMYK